MPVAPLSQIIAEALVDARASVCTHVPGYGGTEVFRDYRAAQDPEAPYSFHEEVAYTVAHGAGLAGYRAATVIKTHGFAKAANSILSSISTGTLGGTVIIAFDDPDGSHSDNIIDAESFIRGTRIPFANLTEDFPYDTVLAAFEKSEAVGLPVAIMANSQWVAREFEYKRRNVDWRPLPFRSMPHFNVACPPMSQFQKRVLDLKQVDNGSWRELSPPALVIPDSLPPNFQKVAQTYLPVFTAFREVIRNSGASFVAGDAGTSGLFAFDPYRCIDALTYMGGSTSLALGAKLAGMERTWAVTGEFSFVAAGILGLLEAANRGAAIKLMVLDNRKAAATGSQKVDPHSVDIALAPYAQHVTVVTANDGPGLRDALSEADQSQDLAILRVQV